MCRAAYWSLETKHYGCKLLANEACLLVFFGVELLHLLLEAVRPAALLFHLQDSFLLGSLQRQYSALVLLLLYLQRIPTRSSP